MKKSIKLIGEIIKISHRRAVVNKRNSQTIAIVWELHILILCHTKLSLVNINNSNADKRASK